MNRSADFMVIMVVSPGEERLAADSLQAARRAAERGGHTVSLRVIDNRPSGAAPVIGGDQLIPVTQAPRPYFEIARTILAALATLAPSAAAWIVKIDPDTRVLSPDFFSDIACEGGAADADFVACLSPQVALADHMRLTARLWMDAFTPGLTRDRDRGRYGRVTRARWASAWHAPFLSPLRQGLFRPRRYPSGGFYALRSRMLEQLQKTGWLTRSGPNGLEWNDDTLLPLAVRALDGRLLDLRATASAPHWRWLHGERYFDDDEARVAGLRALHPLKDNAVDWRLRAHLNSLE